MLHPFSRRRAAWRLVPDARRYPMWRWPLRPDLDRDPIVLAEYADERRRGVDLGYAARPTDLASTVPIYAAQDGEIMRALETETGFAISIDHGDRRCVTHYAHLRSMFVVPFWGQRTRRQRVCGDDVIGFAATSPIHVRFELWKWTDDRGYVAVDPIAQMTSLAGPLFQTPAALCEAVGA